MTNVTDYLARKASLPLPLAALKRATSEDLRTLRDVLIDRLGVVGPLENEIANMAAAATFELNERAVKSYKGRAA
jgi:hypothetical protein